MRNQLSGTINVPVTGVPSVGETVKALNEQVNNLQRRYYRSLAPDCEIKTESDKYYFRAVTCLCLGLMLWPLLPVGAYYLYKAKSIGKEE